MNFNFKSPVPKEISKLTKLTELYLWGCQLTSLPEEINELKKLGKLEKK